MKESGKDLNKTDYLMRSMARNENKTVLGVAGVILAILGVIWTIPLSLKGKPYVYGLAITGAMIIVGIMLIAWAFGD